MSTFPRKDVRAALTLSLDPTTADARMRAALEEGGLAGDCDPIPSAIVRRLIHELGTAGSEKRARKRLQRLLGPLASVPEHPTPRKNEASPGPPPLPEPKPQPQAVPEPQPEPEPEPQPEPELAASPPPTPPRPAPSPQAAAESADSATQPRTRPPIWLLFAIGGVLIVLGVLFVNSGEDPEPVATKEEAPPEMRAPTPTPDVVAEPAVELPPFDAALVELAVHAQNDALDAVDAGLIVLLSPQEFENKRRDWIQRQVDVQKLYGEELALQTIGLMPEQFHYPQFLQDMLCQPVAHYFDEEDGVVYRTRDGLPVGVQMETIPPRPLRLASTTTAPSETELAAEEEGAGESETYEPGADDNFGSPDAQPDAPDELDESMAENAEDAESADVAEDDVVDPPAIPLPPVPAPFPFRPLVYALQYQHFDLAEREELNQRGTVGNDQALTTMAVMQGDAFATWLDVQHPDIDIWSPDGLLAIDELEARIDGSGALVGMPEFLARVAKFPELQGARWTLQRMRNGITHTALFETLPTSTGDILHPERSPGAVSPEAIDVVLPYKYLGVPAENVVYDGVLGEFGLVAWLELVGLRSDAAEITNTWRGDRLWCVAIGRKALVVHASVWADEAAARAFEDAVRGLYVQRYGPVYNYRARVMRRGNAVVWMEGILPGDLTKLALKTTINQLVAEPEEPEDSKDPTEN